MKAPVRATAQAILLLAAWVVSNGLRAEEFSSGRMFLQQAAPAASASESTPSQADSNQVSAPADTRPANDFVTAPRRQPGVFADERDQRLDSQRGGADTHVETTNNTNNANANLGNNVASNLTTGGNVIRDGSFSNTNGIPMVIQNSGNNVIIQNSTILNLRLQ